jgi:RNA polymerase sigma-70 factor (ECF subfamily)
VKAVTEIDGETLERCRAYLKLIACTQLDSFLGQQVDASDLVQQTLLDAVAKAEQFRGRSEAELISWLCQILANNVVNAFRYHSRAKRDLARIQSLDESLAESFRRLEALAQSCSTPNSPLKKSFGADFP